MSAFEVAIAVVSAGGLASAVVSLVSATRELQRRARRLAGASARVSNIQVTYEDGHTQVVQRPTADAVRAIKQAIQIEAVKKPVPRSGPHPAARR